MAQKGIIQQQDQDKITRSVCLDLMKEPVTIPCGHSYCIGCIQSCWDEDEQKGVYSCPQCRESFIPRPALRKNTMLAELVETLKKTGGQQTSSPSAAQDSAGPGDVDCDFCAGSSQHKAIMSCLVCMASYCETHLQPHNTVPVLKKHNLVKATAQLQEKMCPGHDKLLEIYCRTDQQCICYLCTMDEHKGHDTVSAAAERTDKQTEFGVTRQNIQQRVQEREKELNELRQALKSLNDSVHAAVEDIERLFTELILSIETKRSEVKELIRKQQETAVSQVEELVVQLEQEIAELKRGDAELEQLSYTDDHIHFLQSFQCLSSLNMSSDIPRIDVRPLPYFRDVSEDLSKLSEPLEEFLKETWAEISATVSGVDILNPAEPRTRDVFLQYSCPLTLDFNTTNTQIYLSNGNRKATIGDQAQPYPNHPDRFTYFWQVLCREGLSGRCYWEVEWSGKMGRTAVSYKDISRTGNGNDSSFGHNEKSWSLQCTDDGYSFRHNNVETKVSGPWSSRVGVYLDHKAGTLSFYGVSDTMTLLHRVQTTFTQPLYPGIWFYNKSDTAELACL